MENESHDPVWQFGRSTSSRPAIDAAKGESSWYRASEAGLIQDCRHSSDVYRPYKTLPRITPLITPFPKVCPGQARLSERVWKGTREIVS